MIKKLAYGCWKRDFSNQVRDVKREYCVLLLLLWTAVKERLSD